MEKIENWLLSDKDKNIDTDWLTQNIEQLFEVVAGLFKSKDEKVISKVCIKLTNLYKDKESKHQNLIINCIPILLNYYFSYFYDEKICPIIEVCVLTIYNLSLSDENVKLNRIRVPNLSAPSIYHSPHVSSTQFELTESALGKYETEYVITEEHFKPYVDTNNSEKRFSIIKFLLLLYYSKLVNLTKPSKVYFCDMCLKMCKINRQTSLIQPIYLNSDVLIEMLHALFYLFNNGLQLDAYIAIEAITLKAEEELLADVLLICNSIKNLIKLEPSMQNALNSYENSLRHNNNANSNNTGGLQSRLMSTSLSFTRKKSLDPLSGGKVDLPSELHPAANEVQSNLNDVYISPNCEIRKEAKRASVKLMQQQQKTAELMLEEEKKRQQNDLDETDQNASEVMPQAPPPPDYPPPSLNSVDSINKSNENDYIPNIDEGQSDEYVSEKL